MHKARGAMMALGVYQASVGKIMENVTILRPRERIRQDGEAIAVIYRNLGTSTAEQMVTRALGELALAMAGIAAQVKAQALTDLTRQLKKLQRMAENLGMISLATVSEDARICLERCDSTAFAAVWARLLRVAERCLANDKGFADISG
jgi:hypothetical protein